MTQPSSRRRLVRWSAPLLAGGLLLAAACSKNDTTTTQLPATTASTASTGATSGGSTGANTGSSTKGTTSSGDSLANLNGAKVWFTGFSLTLGKVSLDQAKGQLTVETKVKNNGTDPSSPSIYVAPVSLEAGGSQITTLSSWKDTQNVVGGAEVNNAMVFNVDSETTIDPSKTTLVFGSSSQQQAKVPMSGTGTTVSLEPVTQQAFSAPIVLGTTTVTVKATQVRYDLPNKHEQADAGKAFLTLAGTIKNGGTNTVYLGTTGVTITGADGETYTATEIQPSSVPASQSDDKFIVTYVIKAPVSGTWTLTINADFDGDGNPDNFTGTANLTDTPSGSGSTGTTTGKGTTTTSK